MLYYYVDICVATLIDVLLPPSGTTYKKEKRTLHFYVLKHDSKNYGMICYTGIDLQK